jgi:hypothetical protein
VVKPVLPRFLLLHFPLDKPQWLYDPENLAIHGTLAGEEKIAGLSP